MVGRLYMSTLLKLEGISVSYGEKAVLRGISLEVSEGETVGVVGPNGSGKTTLMRVITGVIKPREGRISLNGVDTCSLTTGDRARMIAVVPQNPSLPLAFSAIDMVLMGRTPHLGFLRWEGKRDIAIAQRALEFTDTWHLAMQPLLKLSGGERQRVLIARALAQEAPLLLLDEPTSSLDLSHQTEVMDLMSRVQQEKKGAVLLALHDLTLAARYCHRIVMLKDGTVFAQGRPQDVLTHENILQVYSTRADIISHPTYGTTVVLPLSQDGDNTPV